MPHAWHLAAAARDSRVLQRDVRPRTGGQLTAHDHKRVGCALHGTHRPLRYVLVCDLVKLVLLYLLTTVESSASSTAHASAR